MNKTGFLGHLGVEHDLELEIAELVSERVHVVARDCIGHFISFFDRKRRDGGECLDRYPFAAAQRVAKPAHDLDARRLKWHEGSTALAVI